MDNSRTAPGGSMGSPPAVAEKSALSLYTKPIKPMDRPLVGREKELLKLKAGLCRPEYSNVILLADAGTGKALANDEWIPVNDERGYVQNGDLKVGDEVFDEEGHPTKIIGVFPQGKQHAYRVTLSNGASVVCNDEHLWAARTAWGHHQRYDYDVVSLSEMMDYGILKRARRPDGRESQVKQWYIPRPKAVHRDSVSLPVHPYALGVFLGDGNIGSSMRRLSVSSVDEEVVKRVGRLIGAADVVPRSCTHDWEFLRADEKLHNNMPVKYIQFREMADMEPSGLVFGKKSAEKRIPPVYFTGSVEQRTDLLHGLMDTDGTVGGNDRTNCNFSTVSGGLAEDVMTLAASLGYVTSLTFSDRPDKEHANREYEVHFSVDNSDKPGLFWLSKHKQKFEKFVRNEKHFYHRYDDIAIASVEDLGTEIEMTCIYVDSPTHLYQATRRHIVTHNTALVQGLMAQDSARTYLEVDLAKMIADLNDANEMASRLKDLFFEVEDLHNREGTEIVLFMDEFHQIIQLSAAAVEALKPLLADAGTRGIKVIAATTLKEFNQFVAPNQPLVERLQRINIPEPGKKTVIEILKAFAKKYGVEGRMRDEIYELIFEYTSRYIPSNSQPRKSILMLDAMVGYHRATSAGLDKRLLAEVIYQSEGINVNFKVDATQIKKRLDKAVFAQELATTTISNALQVAVADLNDKSRPMCNLLFSGSTGTGKDIFDEEPVPVYTADGSVCVKRNGDLTPGDFVFDRMGRPSEVLATFPQGVRRIYEVELTDGRVLRVGKGHLWAYKSRFGNGSLRWKVADTETLFHKMEKKYYNKGRKAVNVKFVIPMNQAVQWPKRKYKLDPYVLGAFLGNGLFCENAFSISSSDEETVRKIAVLIGASGYQRDMSCYSWTFWNGEMTGSGQKSRFHTRDLFSEIPELIDLHSREKFIPDVYKHGSVEQRWDLIRGLFDTDGHISKSNRANVSYSSGSRRLVYDIQKVLFSLGIQSSIRDNGKRKNHPDHYLNEYHLHVKCNEEDKPKFFTLDRKLRIADRAAGLKSGRKRVKKFGEVVGIRDIRKTDQYGSTTCILVDNPEHLYQAGIFVISHNTEVSKALAAVLFGSDRSDGDENQSGNRNLLRFDMSEYALPESVERFRRELTSRVWERPFSVILLDEIEKACAEVIKLLLQVLDDGRLTDAHERQVVFTNAYIIMTTNAGSEVYRNIGAYSSSDTGDGREMKKYMKAIRRSIISTTGGNKFPPELLGRVDAIVPFQPLSEETLSKIVTRKLQKLSREVLRKHGAELLISPRVVPYLVKDNMDTETDSGGARQALSKLKDEVTVPVSAFLNAHHGVLRIGVNVTGKMAYEDKTMLESEASIVVAEVN